MGTPNRDRQRQFVARQRARGLRPHLVWLSDDQHAAVRELLQHGPANGHNHSSNAELIATQDAIRKAQSDLTQALSRIRDLKADLAALSRANATLRANLSDAQRATRVAIACVVVVSVIAALALLAL